MRYSLERCCQTLKFFKKIGKDTWRVLDLSASVFGYNLTGIYLGVEGLEPSRPIDQQILSLLCLPFHHIPMLLYYQLFLQHATVIRSEAPMRVIFTFMCYTFCSGTEGML